MLRKALIKCMTHAFCTFLFARFFLKLINLIFEVPFNVTPIKAIGQKFFVFRGYRMRPLELNELMTNQSQAFHNFQSTLGSDSLHLKLVSAIFYHIFIFHQMIALQELWKMSFISPKKLFSFSRYSNFCIPVFPSFSPCQPLF